MVRFVIILLILVAVVGFAAFDFAMVADFMKGHG